MNDLSKSLATAFGAVVAAPWPFIAALAVVGSIIWKVLKWGYASQLSNQQSTIDLLERRLSQRTADEALSMALNAKEHVARAQAELTSFERSRSSHQSTDAQAEDVRPADAPAAPIEYVPESVSADDLMLLLKDKTAVQGQAAVSPYLGRRIVYQSYVIQVNMVKDEVAVALQFGFARVVYCYFDPPNEDLKMMSIGDLIRIDGQIKRVYSLGIELNHCVRLVPIGV